MKQEITTNWKRHTFIWLTGKGRHYAANHIQTQEWESFGSDTWKENLICNHSIPGIICRQPFETDPRYLMGESGCLLAGFSHWKFEKGNRMRITAYFQETDVLKSCSPFDLCMPAQREDLCRAYPLLEPIFNAADKYKIEPGLFGSVALEWVSGYPYRNPNSDLDLCIRYRQDSDLESFGQTLLLLEEQYRTRIDVEIETTDGYGIKLKELFTSGKTILGKGLYDVKLFKKETLQQI